MPWMSQTKLDLFRMFKQPLNSTEFRAELDDRMTEIESIQGQDGINQVEDLIQEWKTLDAIFKSNSQGRGVGSGVSAPRGPLAEVGEAIKFHPPSEESDLEWNYHFARRRHDDLTQCIRDLMGLEAWLNANSNGGCCGTITFA